MGADMAGSEGHEEERNDDEAAEQAGKPEDS